MTYALLTLLWQRHFTLQPDNVSAEHEPALHQRTVTSNGLNSIALRSIVQVSPHMQAGDSLVVLEVESTEVCQTGLEEVEHHWKEDKDAALNPCKKLKHVLQRTARDSPDVRFVTLEVAH